MPDRQREIQIRHFRYGASVATLAESYGLTDAEVRRELRGTPAYIKRMGRLLSRRARKARKARRDGRAQRRRPPPCDVARCGEPSVMDDGTSRQNRCRTHVDVPQVRLPALTPSQLRSGRWPTRYPVQEDGTPIGWLPPGELTEEVILGSPSMADRPAVPPPPTGETP